MPHKARPIYSLDFETVVNPEKTRVWLWGKAEIFSEEFEYGTNIDTFIESISKENCIGYFHNLKFDGTFILDWLFRHHYNFTTEKKPDKGTFSCLISDMGLFYTIKIHWYNGYTTELRDSLKLITMPVEAMPRAFDLDIEKLSIDYKAVRELDHVPTKKEIEYVKHDVLVVAKALKYYLKHNLNKLTAASNALNNFKSRFDEHEFNYMFPNLTLNVDHDCRLSYKGGWTYCNPKYQDVKVGSGRVYDVNSMYPWAMKYCLLPYGLPIFYMGEYKEDKLFPLYIQCLRCKFKLKPGKYPSIQLKHSMMFAQTEYISESTETTTLHLTSVDLELMKENYDLYDIEYVCGYKFQAKTGIFAEYIDYWYDIKTKAKKEKNTALQTLAKLFLNSLYGKFGSNPIKRSKYPYLDPDKDCVCYTMGPEEVTKGLYVPIATFITSYCRDKIIRAANACGDSFLYADTDSLHILGTQEPNIDIDDYKLGYFKLEGEFTEALYHRAKCYIETFNGEMDKKCAGMPSRLKKHFNYDNLKPGSVWDMDNGIIVPENDMKLRPVNVPGGQVLIPVKFSIK